MTQKLKNKIINSLEDIKAVNPIAIDVTRISSLTDFMIIASGTSNRHIAAISEHILESLKETNISGIKICLLYTSPSPRDGSISRMPSSA